MGRPRPAGQNVSDAATTTMVLLMAATLLVVVASQVPKIGSHLGDVAAVVPFYAAPRSRGGRALRRSDRTSSAVACDGVSAAGAGGALSGRPRRPRRR
jgi:hypothetical protein